MAPGGSDYDEIVHRSYASLYEAFDTMVCCSDRSILCADAVRAGGTNQSWSGDQLGV